MEYHIFRYYKLLESGINHKKANGALLWYVYYTKQKMTYQWYHERFASTVLCL